LTREKSAEMRIVEVGEMRAVMKDYSRRSRLNRLLWAPLLIRREAQALADLAGIEGVPRLYAQVDRLALVVEYIDGTPCNRLREGDLDAAFFGALEATLAEVHARGRVHGDLKAASNVIRRPDGRPCLIDFATSFRKAAWWHLVHNRLFRSVKRLDRAGIAKLKETRAPHLMTDHDVWLRTARSLPERLMSRVRRLYRRLRKPKWRPGFGPDACDDA